MIIRKIEIFLLFVVLIFSSALILISGYIPEEDRFLASISV